MDTPLQEWGLFAPEPFDSMEQPAPLHPGTENMMLLLTILSGFIVALVAPALDARLRGATGWVLALLPAVLTAYFISLLPQVAAGEPLAMSYP
jgi:hypothetical protein